MMHHLEPSHVLKEFSTFAITEIRPALPADEPFLHGQVGSMASTLRFLARELEGLEAAVADQRSSLIEALETAAARIDDEETTDGLHDLRHTVASADGPPRALEETLLKVADEALALVDGLGDPAAREARAPLYEFLDERVAIQLAVLRGSGGSG
jgi:hypothetical protein